MDAAVPFALVAAVQLLALAAALGLAVAGGAVAYRRTSRVYVVAGGVLLAAAHGLTGALLGDTAGDRFALMRAVAYLLIAAGAGGLATAGMSAVVVPLGAAGAPAAFAAIAAMAAGGFARRAKRTGRDLLVAAFGLTAVSEVLAPGARTSSATAVAMLVLRGLAALAVLAFVARVVEDSLLGKVVSAILAAVLGLALGTALIVGSVATGSLDRDSQARLSEVAGGQVQILQDEKQTSLSLAQVLAGCGKAGAACDRELRATTSRPVITGVVCGADPACAKQIPGGAQFDNLPDGVARAALRRSAAVREVLNATDGHPVATLDLLLGRSPSVIALGVVPIAVQSGPRKPYAVAVYATRMDADTVASIAVATEFAATLYIDGHRVATTLDDPRQAAVIDRELDRQRVVERLADPRTAGVSVAAEGRRPGVRYEAIRSEDGDLLGVLALSAESDVILATQRRVLSSLFLGTVAIALLVGLLAVALGRRIVRPVTALTLAAGRVRRGDLDVRTEVRSSDELGVLSRTFDAMTASLAASNDSLVRAAADEAALRGRLETVVDSIADGLLTTDARDRVVGVNRAALDLLAAAEDDVVGRPVADVLSGVGANGEPLLGRLGARRTDNVGQLDRLDGGRVPVALAATPLRDEEGHVVVVRDMTREHDIERMKTEFLSNVSHELRTPLTPIRGYAEILQRRSDLPPEKTTMYAAQILESSVRMSRVVDLLVDVAALEAGRVEPQVMPVPVGDFVDERLAHWRQREPGREFRRRVAARLPKVLVDPTWVGKAYDELVDNAVKYSTGPVTLAAAFGDDPGRVRLTVRDAGEGIPDDRRTALFTPFEQVDGSATRSVGGLGLGLSFVQRVAEDFGLDVVVESTVGKGSAFSLEVPAVASVAPGPAAARRRPAARRAPKGRAR